MAVGTGNELRKKPTFEAQFIVSKKAKSEYKILMNCLSIFFGFTKS
jgi:hypothetical protein